VLVSRRNDDLLRSLAQRGDDGLYLTAQDTTTLELLRESIAGVGLTAAPSGDAIPLWTWLVLGAFGLLLLEPLTTTRRRAA
jgi:hypothetical protein